LSRFESKLIIEREGAISKEEMMERNNMEVYQDNGGFEFDSESFVLRRADPDDCD
jgi:hypothetical protein